MSMSKKHFIELADEIRRYNAIAKRLEGLPFLESQIMVLADFCAGQNPAFKRQRWLDYIDGKVEPNGGKVKSEKLTAPRIERHWSRGR